MVGLGKSLNVNSGFRREKFDRISRNPDAGPSKEIKRNTGEAKRGSGQEYQSQTTTYPDGRSETTTRTADGTVTKSTEQHHKHGRFDVDENVFTPKPTYIDCIPDKHGIGLAAESRRNKSSDRTEFSRDKHESAQESGRSEELAQSLLAAWS